MTAEFRDLTCPVCSSELTVEQLFASAEAQAAFNQLASISIPVGSRVLSYLTLFAPQKNRLSLTRKVKLLAMLLPDLQRECIAHHGRLWRAPLDAWSLAIEQLLASRDAGKLTLPLTSHGYLYAVLAGMADKIERSDEQRAEQERRTRGQQRPQQASVTVRGQALPIGEALQVAYAGKDPALAKIDADARRAAPMPEAVRAKLAEIKGRAR